MRQGQAAWGICRDAVAPPMMHLPVEAAVRRYGDGGEDARSAICLGNGGSGCFEELRGAVIGDGGGIVVDDGLERCFGLDFHLRGEWREFGDGVQYFELYWASCIEDVADGVVGEL